MGHDFTKHTSSFIFGLFEFWPQVTHFYFQMPSVMIHFSGVCFGIAQILQDFIDWETQKHSKLAIVNLESNRCLPILGIVHFVEVSGWCFGLCLEAGIL